MFSAGITHFYLPPTHEPYLPLLPSWKASPPFGWYSLFILFILFFFCFINLNGVLVATLYIGAVCERGFEGFQHPPKYRCSFFLLTLAKDAKPFSKKILSPKSKTQTAFIALCNMFSSAAIFCPFVQYKFSACDVMCCYRAKSHNEGNWNRWNSSSGSGDVPTVLASNARSWSTSSTWP